MLSIEERAEYKKVRIERTAADRCFAKRACYLWSVALAADSVGPATAGVYDGDSADGRQVINLAAVQSDRDHRAYWPPLYLPGGLYVDVGSNVAGVSVQYALDPVE